MIDNNTIIEDNTWENYVQVPIRKPSHIGFLPKTQSVLIAKPNDENHLSRTTLLLKL
jgi:hypothetical protein